METRGIQFQIVAKGQRWIGNEVLQIDGPGGKALFTLHQQKWVSPGLELELTQVQPSVVYAAICMHQLWLEYSFHETNLFF